MTFETHNSWTRRVCATFIFTMAVISLLHLLSYQGTLALGMVVMVAASAWSAPHLALILSTVLTLFGGTFSSASSLGMTLLWLAAAASLRHILQPRIHVKPKLLFYIVFLLYIIAASLLSGGPDQISLFGRAVAASILAFASVIRNHQAESLSVSESLGIAAIIFITFTIILGESTLTGTRFAGVSGNPNRMMFGCLILAGFAVISFNRKPLIITWIYNILLIGTTAYLAILSGSTQAGAAIIGLGVVALVAIWRRNVAAGLATSAAACVVVLLLSSPLSAIIESDSNLRSLSGRTPLFETAWADILSNPVFGLGTTRVGTAATDSASTHSTILSFGLLAGLPAMIAWLIILVISARNLIHKGRFQWTALYSLVVLAAMSFVQAVEVVPLTWTVLVISLTSERIDLPKLRETKYGFATKAVSPSMR